MRIPSLPDWVLHGSYPVPLAALVFLPRLFSRYAHSAWDSGEPWSCTAVHWLLFCFLCFLMVITDFHFLYECFQLLRLCFPRVIITPSSFSWNVKTHEKLLLKKKKKFHFRKWFYLEISSFFSFMKKTISSTAKNKNMINFSAEVLLLLLLCALKHALTGCCWDTLVI